MVLKDELAGPGDHKGDHKGSHRVTRRFLTPLKAETGAGGIVLRSAEHTFHLNSPDATITAAETTLWHAYGAGHPGTIIELTADVSLPWSGEVRFEVL